LTRVYCLAEVLIHAPCLTQVNDDHEHCVRKYHQRKDELHAIIEEQDKKPTNEASPANDERRAACW
jgi:hypothetical protein